MNTNKNKVESRKNNLIGGQANLKANEKNNGITIVALAITIIIIIILSTITINMAFGDNGLIQQAKNTKEQAEGMVNTEEGKMQEVLQEYANVMAADSEITTPEEPTLPSGWDSSKVTALEKDGSIIPIPIGYVASEATGENTIDGGLVIYEGTTPVTDSNVSTAKTSRNQFVWVPVDDINDIAWEAQNGGTDSNGRTNYQGKLYNFTASGATEMTSYGQGTTSYREPDIVTYYDGTDATSNASYFTEAISSSMTGEQFKTQLQEEFNEMIESVDTYGGFYIGRYETGNLAENKTTKPLVVKGNESVGGARWYYLYQNSKLIKANDNVASTMIWGCMWDRTLIWLAETNAKNSENGKSYTEIVNSSTWGNYNSRNQQPTGKDDKWKANNIYDLAGNAYDWTLEVYGINYSTSRVTHGGDCNMTGSNGPASNRRNTTPINYGSNYGTRSALYIAVD